MDKNILEKKVITYTIKRENNINSMYISIQNGEIEVTAPKNFTNKKIQKLVEEKREWILEKIEEYSFKKEYGISRNPVEILGKEYKIKITYKNIKVPELNIEKGEIRILLPPKNKIANNKKILNLAIEKMYESIAGEEIERAMEKSRITLGYAPEDYQIKKMNNKLAKTSKGIITINPEIVKYSRSVIDEIIKKEFLKLKVKSSK